MIDLLVVYYTWLLEMIPLFIVFAVSTFFHEFGHYVFAKREGIYVSWGLLPQPHIKTKSPYNSRWKYLSGFLFSMIALPFWCVVFGWENVWIFILLQIGGAGSDLFSCIFYGRLLKKREKRLGTRETDESEIKGFLLDVGCGDKPKGDINCDIKYGGLCKNFSGKISNFVLCDAQYLPFRDQAFSTAYSSQVVEHVKNPRLMTKELLRVSKKKVEIMTPHIFSYASRGLPLLSKLTGFTYHIHSFNQGYWKKLLSNFKHATKIRPCLTTEFWWVPLKSIEIVIEVEK